MVNITPLWMAIIASGVGLYAVAKKYPQYFRKIAPAKLPAPQGSKLLLTPQPSTREIPTPDNPITYLFRDFMYNPHPRGAPYLDAIHAAENAYGIPRNLLVRLIEIESMYFDPEVIACRRNSPTGARGIAQILPSTARDPGYGIAPLNPCNVPAAINFAGKYLKAMQTRTGSWRDALLAYNQGLGCPSRGVCYSPAEGARYVALITEKVPVA